MPSSVRSRRLETLERRLNALREREQWRECVPLESAPGPWIEVGGQRYLHLASNNYLNLATHPEVIEGAAKAAREWGAGAGAARLITGSSAAAAELERELAAFKKAEAALLFSSGYMANIGLIQALARSGDLLFCDRLNHASLIDAARLSRAEARVYPHGDVAALREMLEEAPVEAGKLILTDGVFSMDGDIAPLVALSDLAQEFDAWLVVDDAHGTGTIGPEGRGACALAGVAGEHVVQVVTLSKALGTQGGAVIAARQVIETIVNTARSFIFETALAPPMVGAAREALRILRDDPVRRERLASNVALMREGLARLGHPPAGETPTPIFPVVLGSNRRVLEVGNALRELGYWITPIRPPTVPEGTSRLRITVMAEHDPADLKRLLNDLERVLPR